MKRSFFINAVVLTLTTQLLRVIGLFFIAFLSGKIGAEGIGLYQLISSVYFLASTLAVSGIGVAVSRLTAESVGKSGQTSTSNVVRRSAAFGLLFGLLAGGILFIAADFIGTTLLGDARTILSLKALSPGLPFMAVTTALRGYFYGRRKVIKPASQMIFEQGIQLLILFPIMNSFVPMGLEYACLAVAISSTTTEILSFGYGLVLYMIEKNRSRLLIIPEKSMNRQILNISLPVAASSYLRSGLRTAENVLIPAGLRKHGATGSEALSQFGLLGMVMPVLLFPSSFLTAISALLLPEISEANSINNIQKVRNVFSRVFQLTALLSLLFSGIFIAFSKEFGVLLYNNEESGMLLMLLAPLIPLIYLDFIVDSMLNGLGKQMKTLKINVLDYSIRIGLILLLIPEFGFPAYIVIFYISTVLNAFLSIRHLLIASGSSIKYLDWILKPMLCVTIAALIVKAVFKMTPIAAVSGEMLAIKVVITAVLYIAFLFAVRCLSRADLAWFKHMAHEPPRGRITDKRNSIRYQDLIK